MENNFCNLFLKIDMHRECGTYVLLKKGWESIEKMMSQNCPTLTWHEVYCVVSYDMLLTDILLRAKQATCHRAIIW